MSGHVQPRGDGVWRIFVDDGRDPLTGRRRRITRTFRGTKKEAEREAEKFVTSVRDGRHAGAATTFGALLDAWLEHAEPHLGVLTMRTYRSKVEVHIRPALGDVKLRHLTTEKLDAFYRELLKRGAKPQWKSKQPADPKPLSPRSVLHIHAVIRRACRQGCKWGWLDRNPAELAEPPSIIERNEDLPEVAALLTILDRLTIDMRELAWLAIISSARRAELCGLRWIDLEYFDIEGAGGPRKIAEAKIRRSIAELPNQIIEKTTKTNRERKVAIDAVTVTMLTARHARQAEKALAFGVPLAPDAYIFADQPGGAAPLKPSSVTKRWSTAAHNVGVKCTFHDLRHFSITELLEAGFEIGGVSKRAGHAKTSMTQDRYQHTRRAGDLAAAEHLAGLLTAD